MPGMDGLEATRRIAAGRPGGRAVLILTTFDRDDYLFAALRAGASGFLLKNGTPEELIDAIRVLRPRRRAARARSITRRADRHVRRAPAARRPTGPPRRPTALAELTAARARGAACWSPAARRNAEIAAELHLGEATVKTHVSRVLHQARPARPGAGGRLRLRARPGHGPAG